MSEQVNILWTGGWDSTFQLLQLLLIRKTMVTPFYLIDAERPSTGKELQTMKRIKERLFKDYPHTRELIQPGRFYAVEDIAPDAEITAAFDAICKEHHLGVQYEWFARFCKQQGLADMQMGIQHGGRIHHLLKQMVSADEDGFHIQPGNEAANEYTLFHRFNFSIIGMTKLQMAEYAKEQGWERIMHMTWFCFTPKRDGTPCGKCNPCRYAIEEGLGWRIPERKPLPLNRRILRRMKIILNRS
jgi:hypothetical protein